MPPGRIAMLPAVDRDAPTQLDDATEQIPGGTPVASGPASERAAIGRYRVDAVLGHGGEGIVLAAHDPMLNRPVAIKLLRPGRRDARQRLLREGQTIARLRHPNVVTIYDVGLEGDDLFIAMELV